MPRIRVHILLTLSLGAAPALAACVGASAPMAALAIALTPCQLSVPDSAARIKAKCGTLTVFEKRWWLFGCISGSRCCLGDEAMPQGRRWPLPRRETL